VDEGIEEMWRKKHDPPGGEASQGEVTVAVTPEADELSPGPSQPESSKVRPLPGALPASQNERIHTFPNAIGDPIFIGTEPRLGSAPAGLPEERYTLPDSVLDGAAAPGLAIRGASLRGDEHRFYGTTRQDSMGIWKVSDKHTEAFLVCVADGVGSQPLSQLGSLEACRLVHEYVPSSVTALLNADEDDELPGLCQELAERVALELAEIASRVRADPKELSTTLVAALVDASPVNPDERRYVAFGVGDSGAFLLRDRVFHALFADQHDTTITSTGTNALPTSVGRAVTYGGMLVPGDMLMICTDGLSNPMRNAKVTEQLTEWWGQGTIPQLALFGWQLSFRAKTYSDDRSAVCVWGL
jgi:serine/threonine protein phosphatase PrpC